jgi:hypothetical protein
VIEPVRTIRRESARLTNRLRRCEEVLWGLLREAGLSFSPDRNSTIRNSLAVARSNVKAATYSFFIT